MRKSAFVLKDPFRVMNRALSDEERSELRDSIQSDGVLQPVTVMQGDVLVDGFNRDEICRELGIETPFRVKHFQTEDDAFEWAIRQQLARRNLTPQEYNLLVGRLYNERKKTRGRPAKKIGHSDLINSTADTVAKKTGVSEKTVRRSAAYAEAHDSLPKAIQKFVFDNKVPQKEVIALAAFDVDSQKSIVADFKRGLYSTFQECLTDSEPEEEEVDPLEEWRAESDEQHRQCVTQLNSIARRIKEIAADQRGGYLKHAAGRIAKAIDDAKSYIESNRPVEISDGTIVTKFNVQQRKRTT